MGFFRIGIGRRVSVGLGPVTFYGGGGRKRKPAPRCAKCGKRTSNKVCASCRKELEKIVKTTVPAFQEKLHLACSSQDLQTRKSALKDARKSLRTLNKCARLSVSWTSIDNARRNYRYGEDLYLIYGEYCRYTKNADSPKNEVKAQKLELKYNKVVSKFVGESVPEFKKVVNGTKTSNPSDSAEMETLNWLANGLKDMMDIAGNTTLKINTRIEAFNTALEAIDKMIPRTSSESLTNQLKEIKETIIKKRKSLIESVSDASPEQTEQPGDVENIPDDVFTALEKLGNLKEQGVLTEEEFQSKKAELLARI